jgi:hypothetical protein
MLGIKPPLPLRLKGVVLVSTGQLAGQDIGRPHRLNNVETWADTIDSTMSRPAQTPSIQQYHNTTS